MGGPHRGKQVSRRLQDVPGSSPSPAPTGTSAIPLPDGADNHPGRRTVPAGTARTGPESSGPPGPTARSGNLRDSRSIPLGPNGCGGMRRPGTVASNDQLPTTNEPGPGPGRFPVRARVYGTVRDGCVVASTALQHPPRPRSS
ncbi:MAG: hypothetical protein AVDCRST_MAG33-1173 [uncultured Thermomicrobiales bacterium]|uniref:Uncharacterized protein n=1 Tax=uncultured Thermomicrobiales bacterium TaxID=1645740 RepID=A0A6J4UM26_9BACT|nr:MAG: hypothetical protein AVDCRST_MAG33-1173 [uncultured Thermomicrobiales bacterium]